MEINIIVAIDNKRGIGKNNILPWNIPNELKYFSKLTKGNGNNAVVMGRKTWESLPKKPLNNRENLILSKTLNYNNISKIFTNKDLLLKYCKEKKFDVVWVIGGEQIYKEFLNDIEIDNIYITYIKHDYKCDKFFPLLDLDWKLNKILKNDNQDYYEYQIFNKR